MTIAELKRRLQLGTKIRQVWVHYAGDVDHVLTVNKVQTNAIRVSCPDYPKDGWITIPKKNEVVFTEGGWERWEFVGENKNKLAEYR